MRFREPGFEVYSSGFQVLGYQVLRIKGLGCKILEFLVLRFCFSFSG